MRAIDAIEFLAFEVLQAAISSTPGDMPAPAPGGFRDGDAFRRGFFPGVLRRHPPRDMGWIT